MRINFLKTIALLSVLAGSTFGLQAAVLAQDKCLSAVEVQTLIARINSPEGVTLNKSLASELLKLRSENQKAFDEAMADKLKQEVFKQRIAAMKEKTTPRLCRMLKDFGWPTARLVGPDGAAAAFHLLRNDAAFSLQVELLPLMVAAVKQDEIRRADFAGLVDRIRVDAGVKQLFGTQATVVNGLLVLFPIEAEAQVDARRKQYGLGPLADQMRSMEASYRMPLVKAPATMINAFRNAARPAIEKSTAASALGINESDDDEVVRVESNLASVNVSVYSDKSRLYTGTLGKTDFRVFEDDREQELTFFATTDVPFDLVLLLDVSGSTQGKRNLIRSSTKRFIEAARPTDRLAIITFSDKVNILSPLTADRVLLLESIKKIEDESGSNVWDALSFTIDQVIGPKSLERRRAIVLMSDGVDNALMYGQPAGSRISFADLLETVRRNDALVIPIYLDTERDNSRSQFVARSYENARRTLALLADESGGLYYQARKIEDLKGVYEQVIEDLGRVYSLGYKPTNEKRDGSWRALKIQIPAHPELVTRARAGYYAN